MNPMRIQAVLNIDKTKEAIYKWSIYIISALIAIFLISSLIMIAIHGNKWEIFRINRADQDVETSVMANMII